jgi:RNA polymerase sigma-70 factor (ECF subfamily)
MRSANLCLNRPSPLAFTNMATPSRDQFQKEAFPFMEEILASALRMTRQRENAEDLLSEVYSRAWKSYGQFQPGTNMRAWLYKILTNTFINHYRHNQREPGMVHLDKPDAGDDDGHSSLYDRLADTAAKPDQILANRFLDRDIQKAIDSLPEEFRMVVVLCDVQNFAYQEAADILDIPIGTVRSRLFRGRRLLQKILWDQAVATGVVSASGGSK